MAFSEPVIICKKHPQHKQQPGVCSCCLREKLSKINGTTTTTTISSIIPSSLSSSASSSNNASPPGGLGHRRITSDVAGGHYSFVTLAAAGSGGGGGVGGGLKKSRSIAFVARGGRVGINGKKKKEGFWSKLIKSTGKRTNRVIVH
ncbi:hypothetical protein P3S68_020230 [Capsicum galapagoense]